MKWTLYLAILFVIELLKSLVKVFDIILMLAAAILETSLFKQASLKWNEFISSNIKSKLLYIFPFSYYSPSKLRSPFFHTLYQIIHIVCSTKMCLYYSDSGRDKLSNACNFHLGQISRTNITLANSNLRL